MTSEQGSYVVRMLEESKRFTEDILAENQHLRTALAELRAREESRIDSAEAVRLRRLLTTVEDELSRARLELNAYKKNLEAVQAENTRFAEQYVRIEQQNSQLASMYVASYRLHSTLDFGEVVTIIKEILINLIGTEEFAVYVIDEKAGGLHLAGFEHSRGGEYPATIALGQGPIGQAAQDGQRVVATNVNAGPSDEPIASIPLVLEETVVGVIAIHRLLRQKDGFEPVDFELFELLASHAAAALFAARQFTLSRRKLDTLQNLLALVKEGAT